MTKMKIIINPAYEKLVPRPPFFEYEALKADIKEHGLLLPILVNSQGIILDGHIRYKICQELGIETPTQVLSLKNEKEERDFVLTTGLFRRQLPVFQKAVLAFRWAKQYDLGFSTDSATDSLALRTGVSKGALHRTKWVQEYGSTEQYNRCYKARLEDGSKTLHSVYNDICRGLKVKKLLKETEGKTVQSNLILGDFITADISPNSIDCIVTDPPYPKEDLYRFHQLAEFATKVLKPGGSVAAMSGQMFLPEVFEAMKVPGLTYHWTLALLTLGAESPELPGRARNTNSFWKPILWYVKGKYVGKTIGDVLKSDANDKTLDRWQQSVSATKAIVQAMSLPGEMVLDPMMGTGTTGCAALELKRSFVGIESRKDIFNQAKGRISKIEELARS